MQEAGGEDKRCAQRGDAGTGVFQDAQIGPTARAEGLGKARELLATLGIGVQLCQLRMP